MNKPKQSKELYQGGDDPQFYLSNLQRRDLDQVFTKFFVKKQVPTQMPPSVL